MRWRRGGAVAAADVGRDLAGGRKAPRGAPVLKVFLPKTTREARGRQWPGSWTKDAWKGERNSQTAVMPPLVVSSWEKYFRKDV